MNEMKTVRVWIDNDYVEFEMEKTADMSEDEFCEKAVLYVYDTISIEII